MNQVETVREVILTLNMRPYAKKNSRQIRRRGKAIFTVPSDNYTSFATIATAEIKSTINRMNIKLFEGPVTVRTIFYVKGRTVFDGDNMHTGVLDILQDSGIIENDRQVYGGWHEKILGRKDWFIKIIITDYIPSMYSIGEYGK